MIIRLPFMSFRTTRRILVLRILLVLLVTSLAVTTLRFGEYPFTNAEVLNVLTGGGGLRVNMIILDNRLPRLRSAVGTGLAFGIQVATL